MSFTPSQTKALVAVVALVVFGWVFYLSVPKSQPPSPGPTDCPRPPSPFFATKPNVEISLTETIKLLKGNAEPTVIDVIPKEARGIEMIAFLACEAKRTGAIKASEEYLEYVKLLGDISAGKLIQKYVRHDGRIGDLVKHFNKSAGDFTLVVDGNDSQLADLRTPVIAAETWPLWFQKFCSQYVNCIKCSPSSNIGKTISLSLTGNLAVKDGVSYCMAR